MEILGLTKLSAFAGFTWQQLALLASLGIAIGLFLSLTLSLSVS